MMIAFRHGIVLAPAGPDVEVEVEVDVGGRQLVAEVPFELGPTVGGEILLIALTTVAVGVERFDLTMALGRWPLDAPDPCGPLGLAATPVIVLPDPVWSDLATAGAVRAGRGAACVRLTADAPAFGLQLLVAVAEGAEVVLVEGGGGSHLRVARALGGRPLPVLPLPDPDEVAAMLRGCELDVHVPVPSIEGSERTLVAALLRALALDTIHHIVEVDPRPAFAHAGLDMAEASLEARAAGAAGVLAGRLAAGNRRWRAQLEA